MLKRVRVRNYRCLKDVELLLGGLTILVGPNASGKSALLSALRTDFTRTVHSNDVWSHDSSLAIGAEFESDKGLAVGSWSPSRPEAWKWDGRHPGPGSHESQSLQLDVTHLRTQNLLAGETRLSASGGNLTNVFATLTRQQQQSVASEFCRLVPFFGDLNTKPTASGQHALRFQDRWRSDVWYSPQEVSDGTMLVLAYLLLQYQTPQVDLVTIEEPERGLHPYLLGEVLDVLRRMSRGEVGPKPVQFVLATHSAELLNYAEPSEVRFLERSVEDGSVRIASAPSQGPDWAQYFREYQDALGGAWLSGGLGGVPGR